MLGIVVAAILLAVAIPSFNNLSEKYRLKGAAERLSTEIQMARSEAVARNEPINVTVQGGTDWCIGVSDSGACNCLADNDCQVDGEEQAVGNSDFEGIEMGSGDVTILFSGIRGLPDDAKEFEFTKSGKQVTVNLSALGSVRLCSPSGDQYVSGYQDCPEEAN